MCNCTCMPLHMPKTSETCQKSTPCLIKKASRCVAVCTSKTTTFFVFHFRYNMQRFYKKIVCICYLIGSLVKIKLYLFSLCTKDDRLWQIKKKHDWWNNHFSDCNWTVTLLKKRLCYRCFPCEFCKISKNVFSYRTPPVAASVYWWHHSIVQFWISKKRSPIVNKTFFLDVFRVVSFFMKGWVV